MNKNTVADMGTLKTLHAIGFNLIWLKAGTKQPVQSNWTTRKKKTWDEFGRAHRAGYNVGVRLGAASPMGRGYLAAFDIDVKGQTEKHVREVLSEFKRITENSHASLTRAARVISGRGGGSMHIYFRTPRPVVPHTFAKSKELVKVHMPSVKPNRRERERLNEKELVSGTRLRAAWEISLMGSGQQTVLPDSIHPDTGKSYFWTDVPGSVEDFPLIDADTFTSAEAGVCGTGGFGSSASGGGDIPVPFDPASGWTRLRKRLEERLTKLEWDRDLDIWPVIDVRPMERSHNLDPAIIAMIADGAGVTDRSADVFKCATHLMGHGVSEEDTLIILSDPDTVLGEAAAEHAGGRRGSAGRWAGIRWLARYTMPRAKAGAQIDELSLETKTPDAGLQENRTLGEKDTKRQREEISGLVDWTARLERTGQRGDGPPKETTNNTLLVLENVFGKVLGWDRFKDTEVYLMNTPWGGKTGAELTDRDTIAFQVWLRDNYRFGGNMRVIENALKHHASRNAFDSLQNYLTGLKWDGRPRIDTWLKRYCRASGREEYLAAVSRKVITAMVARGMDPGCKFDHMLILQGFQGKQKSRMLAALAGPDWFSDEYITFNDKDSVIALQGRWLLEAGELAGMRKTEVNTLKSFISRQVDRIRKPYGHKAENMPRRCVFIGSTNNDEYLNDETGSRRFWPVSVERCDVEGVREKRDQLFAEGMHHWLKHEPLWLHRRVAEMQAIEEQDQRSVHDVAEESIEAAIAAGAKDGTFQVKSFTMSELFGFFELNANSVVRNLRSDKPGQMRVSTALKRLGYTRKRESRNGLQIRVWTR